MNNKDKFILLQSNVQHDYQLNINLTKIKLDTTISYRY